ncbi:uncharacterized protein RSE6_09332 [Rhynchosporium secalis]|uniref:Uncharacterized protein n=1 Tax=Rhynchosporium secalis TaxID=38038 RepID=A0A1E1MHN3_RHYSE|nr:uncharacterized protein RSE6_09332 [Rhynchosporium secalis]
MQRSQDWASRIRGSVELQMVLACCLISNPHTWTSLILPDIPRSRPKQITALAEEGRYGDKRHELQETARNKRRRRKETRYHADRKVMSEHLKRTDRFTTCRRGEIRKEQTTRHTSTRQQKLGVNLDISREPLLIIILRKGEVWRETPRGSGGVSSSLIIVNSSDFDYADRYPYRNADCSRYDPRRHHVSVSRTHEQHSRGGSDPILD